MNPVIFK